MNHTYLQLGNVVRDVLHNGDTHDKDAELYFFNLSFELLKGGSLDNFVNFFLPEFLFRELLFFFFSLFLPLCSTFVYLVRDLVVAVIDDFNQVLVGLLYGCVVEQHHFEHVADDGFVVDCEVHFERVEFGVVGFQQWEYFFFPHGGGDEIVDEGGELFGEDEFFEDEFVVFHDGTGMELHVEFLEELILFEPEGGGEILDFDEAEFGDEFLHLLLVHDLAESSLHI